MNEADRIVAARLAARTQPPGPSAADLERARRQDQWDALVEGSRPALASLERRGWPGGTMVRLERLTRLGRCKVDEKAAWEVCRHRYLFKQEVRMNAAIYLLSDGCLAQSRSGPVCVLNSHIKFIVGSAEAEGHFDPERGGMWDIPFDEIRAGLERIAVGG
jgi:hypothetical protein